MNEDRLSRWSRLKRDAREPKSEAGPAPQPGRAPQPQPQTEPAEPVASQTPPEVLEANRAAAEAVDPATIGEATPMDVFVREGVPDWLKKRAFAALWRSDPVFANVDGLNDYDEDFARPDLLMGTFKSAWQAGRGYLEELAQEDDGEVEEVVPASEPVSLVAAGDVEDEPDEVFEATFAEDAEVEGAEEVPRVPLRARLTFD